jgi:hypothetical protein
MPKPEPCRHTGVEFSVAAAEAARGEQRHAAEQSHDHMQSVATQLANATVH